MATLGPTRDVGDIGRAGGAGLVAPALTDRGAQRRGSTSSQVRGLPKPASFEYGLKPPPRRPVRVRGRAGAWSGARLNSSRGGVLASACLGRESAASSVALRAASCVE